MILQSNDPFLFLRRRAGQLFDEGYLELAANMLHQLDEEQVAIFLVSCQNQDVHQNETVIH